MSGVPTGQQEPQCGRPGQECFQPAGIWLVNDGAAQRWIGTKQVTDQFVFAGVTIVSSVWLENAPAPDVFGHNRK
jgi:hypothetical protein